MAKRIREARRDRRRLSVELLEDRIVLSGLITSDGDRLLNADQIRASLPNGYDGSGISIGVISNSFNLLNQASGNVLSGDLPIVEVLGEASAVTWPAHQTDEGRAMLQVIHDLAPGARLLFAPAPAHHISQHCQAGSGFLDTNDLVIIPC